MESKIKLSFKKKIERKVLAPSALKNESTLKFQKAEEKLGIDSFDPNFKRDPQPTDEDFAIPLIESKRESKFLEKIKLEIPKEETSQNEGEKTLDELAAAAIEQESVQKIKNYNNRIAKEISAIKVKATDNDEMDELGEISTNDDYERINVDSYGSALLRGMGWNKGSGLGRNKILVDIVEPSSKTFSIDLDPKKMENNSNIGEEEELELKKGSYVFIHSGRNRGTYGMVECVDEDHLLIKSASRGGSILREVEANIKVVPHKEFQKLSRVINKEMYDEYKKKEEDKKESAAKKEQKFSSGEKECNSTQEKSQNIKLKDSTVASDELPKVKLKFNSKSQIEETSNVNIINSKSHSDEHHKNDYDSRENDSSTKRKKDNKYHHQDYDKKPRNQKNISYYQDEHKKSYLSADSDLLAPPWARENLRVRIINKKYKDGRYHKEKVIVHSMDTVEKCTCITSDARILEDLNPSWFETVIPKDPSATVLILRGSYKGEKAKILTLHKDKEKASLQLVHDSSVVLKLHYDDICEYVKR